MGQGLEYSAKGYYITIVVKQNLAKQLVRGNASNIHTYIHAYIYTHSQVRTRAHSCTPTYTHTYTHTCHLIAYIQGTEKKSLERLPKSPNHDFDYRAIFL